MPPRQRFLLHRARKSLSSDIPIFPTGDGDRSFAFLTVNFDYYYIPFRFNDYKRFPFYELFILKEEGKRREGGRKSGGGWGWAGAGEGERGGEERKRE
jgi:hypothetical protein